MRGDETKKNLSEEKEGETIYVERRYCTVCNIEQPIRSKHCKDCNRCVAQYDHHCPWVGMIDIICVKFQGTCVGEKNHLQFFWFLFFQMIEAVWAEINVIF
jgi:palmitoyltransferase